MLMIVDHRTCIDIADASICKHVRRRLRYMLTFVDHRTCIDIPDASICKHVLS